MNKNRRTVGNYTVLHAVQIGGREIVVGEDASLEKERYMCCYVKTENIFERYENVFASDDYAEIIKLFGEYVTYTAQKVVEEMSEAALVVGDNRVLTEKDCIPASFEDNISNKVIVISSTSLPPEYRHASHQLMLCKGGFGANSNPRGRTCHCESLYDGQKINFCRKDVLGTIDRKDLPGWARKRLEN